SRYSYRTKVQRLPIEPISQASANQRKGRCGRVSEGICIRLYSTDVDDIKISKEPFLYGQVLDNTGQPIRWEGRATTFADYLLKTR
ncbi:murein transglycosylase domain-containing protein, partial [Salmonella enterica subsp. enterica serovar Virginia]|nr:murein transglycosylase domain-containing protein [Salmonella enterica subsp. enterica serovar Virginia]